MKFWIVIFVFVFSAAGSFAQEPCKEWEVECVNSWQCIPKENVCDDWVDCDNGWDEGYPTCPCEGFVCPNTTLCIPGNYVCDVYKDCPNGEDENEDRHCPPCFPCLADGDLCIPQVWVCDGARDCKDGADEIGCQKRLPLNPRKSKYGKKAKSILRGFHNNVLRRHKLPNAIF